MGVDPGTAMGCAGGAMTFMGDSCGVLKQDTAAPAHEAFGAGGKKYL
jgi:hypothetical protein